MAYTDKAEFKIPRHVVLKGGVNVEALTGAKTLTEASGMVQILNPNGGTKVVNLPAVKDGMMYFIANSGSGGHDLTVTKPDSLTFVVSNGKGLLIACNDTNWFQVINA